MKKQRKEIELEERRYNCAKVSRNKIYRHEMLGKSRDVVFFSVCGWAGSKSNFGKAGVAVERQNEKKKMCVAVAKSPF